MSHSSDSINWFVCPHGNPNARIRLFLFPYAGGGPSVFGKWVPKLPGDMEGWIAHYPGRGSRYNETLITNLEILVEGIHQAIQPLLDRPFAFLGHSLGGLVAFELARKLSEQNLPQPQMLFISACGAPHLPDPHPPIHKLAKSEFLEALQKLNGIPSELLQKPDVIQLLLPIILADFEAIENYHYTSKPPLTCPIIVFGGLDDPRVNRERLEGWASQTTSDFKSIYLPGDHFFINTVFESVIAAIDTEITLLHAKR